MPFQKTSLHLFSYRIIADTKILTFLSLLGLLISLSACSSQPINRDLEIELQTVERVDLNQYQGLWYEIARFPNRFEKNCEGVTAEYKLKSDGTISVVNSCNEIIIDGEIKGNRRQAKGRARIVDRGSQAKLEVSFYGPFWGDYWILDLDAEYSLSLVGEPSGQYLWILSRTPSLDETRLQSSLDKLKRMGYNIEALYYTKQPPA